MGNGHHGNSRQGLDNGSISGWPAEKSANSTIILLGNSRNNVTEAASSIAAQNLSQNISGKQSRGDAKEVPNPE